MQMYVNDVPTDEIREVEEDDTTYLVVPTTFIKSMNLHRGYVPNREIEKATDRWSGIPAVADHPRNDDGKLVSINNPDNDETPFGEIRSPETKNNGTAKTQAEVWLNVDKAESIGGEPEAVVEAARNREKLSVSSGYAGLRLPSGNYDGRERDKVVGDLRPDHIAILRNRDGRCSLSDGCFAGPNAISAANANLGVMVNAFPDDRPPQEGDGKGTSDDMQSSFNALSEARTPTFSGTTTGSWSAPTFSEYVSAFGWDAEQVDDLSESQKQQIAEHTLLGDPDSDTFDELQVFPVVEPESEDLSENALVAVLGGRGAQADVPESGLESARSVSRTLLEDEFGRDMSGNAGFLVKLANALGFRGTESGNESAESDNEEPENNEMSERTETLVEMGFNAENLPDEDTECFDRIYNEFAVNEDPEDDESEDEETAEAEEDDEPNEDDEPAVSFDTEEEFEEAVAGVVEERIAANKERSEKEELADEIIANSDDHDSDDKDDLMNSEISVLESLADAVSSPEPTPDYGTRRVASGNSSNGDSSGMPALTASERMKEREADD